MTRRAPWPDGRPRGYLVELVGLGLLFLVIYVFLIGGGPTVVGELWARLIGAP